MCCCVFFIAWGSVRKHTIQSAKKIVTNTVTEEAKLSRDVRAIISISRHCMEKWHKAIRYMSFGEKEIDF